ncbi:MAG: hypothetical protein M3Z28_04125 [Candidatus Dormibacteraeota bacterium]|nr:hypothetical protein [Candidatus Dormibacteraeota bacterium]
MSTRTGVEEELAHLRALVEQQQQRLQRLEGQDNGNDHDNGHQPHSRRDMLRLAGLGIAGVAGAAGASVLGALPAAAANGGSVILGQTNSASANTSVVLTSAANYAFKADATNGQTVTTGNSRGLESFGLGTGAGIMAASGAGVGGIFGSSTGPDIQLGGAQPTGAKSAVGSGRLSQILRSDVGAAKPAFAAGAGFGEMVRGGNGEVWMSTPTGWKRQNTLRLDKADGTGGFFQPVRIIDTRTGAGGTTGARSADSMTTWGPFPGTNGIPADAVGIVGNVTVTGFTGQGFLAVIPAGAAYDPNTSPSTMNYNTNWAWANAFTVGFGVGANAGKISIYVGSTPTHVIVDVVAYIQ